MNEKMKGKIHISVDRARKKLNVYIHKIDNLTADFSILEHLKSGENIELPPDLENKLKGGGYRFVDIDLSNCELCLVGGVFHGVEVLKVSSCRIVDIPKLDDEDYPPSLYVYEGK